ncbi:MAG: hypothetical protein Q7T51_04130 [Candidatus Moranbacteria bacterium]|nr:hypothetical protein [Candidatus Moranbacteria bacterium]
MKIITISGVDGSGKSTQIKLLQAYLESQGQRVFYFHAIEFGLATKLANFKKKYCLICKIKGLCQIKPTEAKSVIKANWLQIQLRKIFLRIDICRFKKLLKKLEKEKFDYLLSDRFFYDTVINIHYLENSDIKNSALIRNSKFEIQNSFYMDISPEQIMQRERKPDQGLEYLQKKTGLFKQKITDWNMQIIDASENKEIVFDKIKKGLS